MKRSKKTKKYIKKTWAEATAERLNLTPKIIIGAS
jgi:hypothetical protein